jgi:hypothetical protein
MLPLGRASAFQKHHHISHYICLFISLSLCVSASAGKLEMVEKYGKN